MGSYGLPLGQDDGSVSIAALCAAGPARPRRSTAAVWLWCETGAVSEAPKVELGADSALDAEVQGLMQEWGYTGR